MKKTKINLKQGFTLLELLVVVLIIGILAGIALPQYKKAVLKSRYTQLKTLVHAVVIAQERYYLANSEYAKSFRDLDINIGGTPNSNDNARYFNWGSCSLSYSPYESISCSTSNFLGYQVYYALSNYFRNKRFCFSTSQDLNTLQHKICKEETGQETVTFGDQYWLYK